VANGAGTTEQALPFRITVLEGELTQQVIQTGQPPGVLSLEGTALPYQPLTLGGTQRLKTTYYDGNPNATQQVIGPTEKNTRVNGMWKDSKLNINGGARQLVDVVDDIRVRGVTVEVSWGDSVDAAGGLAGSAIVRIGKIAETSFEILRPQDVRWAIEFEWSSRGGQTSAPVVGIASANNGFTNAITSLNDASDATSSFLETASAKLFGIADPIFAVMNSALAGLETATEAIDLANGALTYNAGVPSYVLNSIGGSVQLALDSLQSLKTSVLSIRLTDIVPVDDGIALLKMQDQLFQILGFVDSANDAMVETQNGAAAQQVPDTLAVVRVAAGSDLRDLALKYYGDPDSWWAIAQYNNFPSSEVPASPSGPSDDPGLPVQIPRLLPGPSSDLRAAC
jgi:hypothetical protein